MRHQKPIISKLKDIFENLNEEDRFLNERQENVIYLRYVKKLSQIETAERLGISQPTLCRIEGRAKQKLVTNYFKIEAKPLW